MRKIERQGKVSDHAEVSRNFLQMHYAPFHRAWFIRFSAKTELRQIRLFRERGRERGEGRVIYTICALFATMFSEKGGEFRGDKFRYGNSKNTYKNNRIGKRT